MQLKIFETPSPHMKKQDAINEAVKEFVAYWKVNNIKKDDLIAFYPDIDYSEPFGYTVAIWVLMNR